MVDIENIKRSFFQIKGKKESIEERINKINQSLILKEKRLSNISKAREVIQIVAQQTQQKLEFHISKLVTTALSAVLNNAPEFIVKISTRRNQSECDLLFQKEDSLMKPIDSSGGGVLDIASFALRIAYWSLRKNRYTLIFDEPFRNVSHNYQSKVSKMVKMLSEKLGIQVIMVSHIPEAIDCADKVIEVEMKYGKSYIN